MYTYGTSNLRTTLEMLIIKSKKDREFIEEKMSCRRASDGEPRRAFGAVVFKHNTA